MKKSILFLMSFCIITGIMAQENKVKTYQIKSGYVKYKPLGKRESGVHEIWWDNYGKHVREEKNITTTTKFFGKKEVSKEHTVTIIKGKNIWSANLEEGTGTQSVNPMYDMVQDNMGQMSESEQEQSANDLLKSLGGKKIGKENFMGYECEITKMWGSKVWMYKGIALKSESKMLGMKSGEEAVDFQPNAKVNPSKFEPLADIDYEKAPGLDEMFGEMGNEEGEMEKIVPLSYPFERFKVQMKKYNPQGYMRMGPMNLMNQGIYTCAWMKGENDMVALSAMSIQNTKELNLKQFSQMKGIETFTSNGNTCYYGKPDPEMYKDDMDEGDEEPMTMLIVVYKKHDMMLMLTGKPDKSKQELLNIHNRFHF